MKKLFINKIKVRLSAVSTLSFILLHVVFGVIGFIITKKAPSDVMYVEDSVFLYFTNNFLYCMVLVVGVVTAYSAHHFSHRFKCISAWSDNEGSSIVRA